MAQADPHLSFTSRFRLCSVLSIYLQRLFDEIAKQFETKLAPMSTLCLYFSEMTLLKTNTNLIKLASPNRSNWSNRNRNSISWSGLQMRSNPLDEFAKTEPYIGSPFDVLIFIIESMFVEFEYPMNCLRLPYCISPCCNASTNHFIRKAKEIIDWSCPCINSW